MCIWRFLRRCINHSCAHEQGYILKGDAFLPASSHSTKALAGLFRAGQSSLDIEASFRVVGSVPVPTVSPCIVCMFLSQGPNAQPPRLPKSSGHLTSCVEFAAVSVSVLLHIVLKEC